MTDERALGRVAAVEGTIGTVFKLLQKLVAFSIPVIALDLGVRPALVGAGIALQSTISFLTILAQARHPRLVSNRAAMIGSLAAMLVGTLIVAGAGVVRGPLGTVLFLAGMAVTGCSFTLNSVFRRRTAARFPGREAEFNDRVYGWGLYVELIGGVVLTALAAWQSWPVATLALAAAVVVVGLIAARSRRNTPEPPPAQASDLTRDSLMDSVRALSLAALAIYAFGSLCGVLYGPTLAQADFPLDVPLALAVGEFAVRIALRPITRRRARRSGLSPRRVVRPGALMLLTALALGVAAYQLDEVWWVTSLALLGCMAFVETGAVPVTNAINSGMARTGERAAQISQLATSVGFALGAGGLWLVEQPLAPVFQLLEAVFADPGMRPFLLLGVLVAALFAAPRIARYLERQYRVKVGRHFEIEWRRRDGALEFRIGRGDWAPFVAFEHASADVPRDSSRQRSEHIVVFRLDRVERRRRLRRPRAKAGRLPEASPFRPRRLITVDLGDGTWAHLDVREPETPRYVITHRDDGAVVLSITRGSDVPATWRFHRSIDHGDRWEAPTGKPSEGGRHRGKRRFVDARRLRALGIGIALLTGAALVGLGAAYAATLPSHPLVQAVALVFAAATALGAIAWGAVVKRARACALLALVAAGALVLFAALIGDAALALGFAACSLVLAWRGIERR